MTAFHFAAHEIMISEVVQLVIITLTIRPLILYHLSNLVVQDL
jgi:hypothetical protein